MVILNTPSYTLILNLLDKVLRAFPTKIFLIVYVKEEKRDFKERLKNAVKINDKIQSDLFLCNYEIQ